MDKVNMEKMNVNTINRNQADAERELDMVIIGSGPAGLTAAIYGVRAKLELVVIEKEMMSGGQILNTSAVDNYPGFLGIGGFELGQKFREHADELGVSFVTDSVKSLEVREDGIKRVVCGENSYLARTVVIASGAHHSLLGAPGEKELTGMGVSYCATCDGALYRDRVTAVVGGGDVALGDALVLARLCKKVYLIHRRDAFRGAKSLQTKVLETENIIPVLDSVVTELRGEGQLKSLAVKNVKSGELQELEVDGLFVAVGIVPESGTFDCVEKDARGYIKAGEDCATSVPGIYAAGDVRLKPLRQVITAAADGANAVESAVHYLNQ